MANPRNQGHQDQDIEGGKQQVGRGGVGGKAEDVADEESVVEQSANTGDELEDEGQEGFDEVAEEADDELDGDIGAADEEDRSSRR